MDPAGYSPRAAAPGNANANGTGHGNGNGTANGLDAAVDHHGDAPKKRIRKSRSRGLRTKTGCLICRQRHKKCDEKTPVCGPCSISNRDCIYADGAAPVSLPHAKPANKPDGGLSGKQQHPAGAGPSPVAPTSATSATAPGQGLDGLRKPPGAASVGSGHSQSDMTPSPHSLFTPTDEAPPPPPSAAAALPVGNEPYYGWSPETTASELLSADLASTRWLDLLATDAAQADGGFSLAPSPVPSQSGSGAGGSAGVPGYRGMHRPPGPHSQATSPIEDAAAHERHAWQSPTDLALQGNETLLFRNFAERAALWLDLFDPFKHFSTYATRLALRNTGLMKAILALSARHGAIVQEKIGQPGNDHNDAIRYYYETLHYVQTALKYNSYAHSEELLGTALVISTYEMLDASDSNWQRHLKGVFWIQRSQDVNGGSGGLRQSVWWAWLRQDIWAAFRERRRCFSFWKPVRDFPQLNQDELADMAVYLLSQSVNYCAKPDASSTDPDTLARRADAGDFLLGMLERWKAFCGPKFKPLPSTTAPSSAVFEPLWIHPPQFGVALQVYSFARILITLHSPAKNGFDGYIKTQRTLSDAVATICGIAMELKDEGCQIISAQCLFGAGLCVQDDLKRNTIISLIDACEARTGWPMESYRTDLRAEWSKGG